MMKTDSAAASIEKQRLSGQSRISEMSFADDDYEDEIIPLKCEDDSQSQSKDDPRRNLQRNNSGSLSEVSELSVGDKSEDQDLAVNLSFPTGDSDAESDADSRALIADWEDDASDVDSLSSGSSRKQVKGRLSSLQNKNLENELDEDAENDLLLVPTKSAVESPDDKGTDKPVIELDVPDYVWKSPESLKKKSIKLETPKSTKSKQRKQALTDTIKIDEESLSGGSALDTGSVLSAPQDQIQTALFASDGVTTPEQLSTPVKDFASPDAIIPVITPTQIAKKKLRKKTYLVEEQEDGKVSRYNPMFYSSESKHAPLVDHSKSKKEKIQAKKQRKREIREERDRMKDFYKTMDSFAAAGLEGDENELREDYEGEKEGPSTPTPTPPSLSSFFASTSSTESETDTSKEGSSGGSDSLLFDDDYSIGSMDSIEGVTKVKKSTRKKKGKKATGKKKATKKKKAEKKRGRRADYEPEDETIHEPERPKISIEERVEAIFTNKELIYQSHPDVEKINPEDANREPRTKFKVKSKAASGGKGTRSRSRSVDRAGREMARKFQKKRSSSSGAISAKRGMSKRSNSSRSLKGYGTSDDDENDSKSKPSKSGAINKLFGKKPRPVRPKPGGAKTRSNSFSAMTKSMKAKRDEALDKVRNEADDSLGDLRMASSEHAQSTTRGKKASKGGLSKSEHGTRRGSGLLSKSNHENGVRAPMRGKRPDRLRNASSKSPTRDKKRDSSKSKSPTVMSRKKLDAAKAEARSPSTMQRRKQLARDESMRRFEEILGKKDITQSPAVATKKRLASPKRDKNKVDSSTHSRTSDGSSKSPSMMRRKRQEASEAKDSSKHSRRDSPDVDRIDSEEKPKSLRKKKSDLDEIKKSKPDPDGIGDDDPEEKPRSLRRKKAGPDELKKAKSQGSMDLEGDDPDEKPKSLRRKKGGLDELRKSKSQGAIDIANIDPMDPEEKPKSARKKRTESDEMKKSKPDPEDANGDHPDDEKPRSSRKKKADSIVKPDPESQHFEADDGDDDSLKGEADDVKSISSRTLDDDEDEHVDEEIALNDNDQELQLDDSSTRRKKGRDSIKRTRSRSRDFFDGMVETVKTVKITKTIKDNINTSGLIKSMKFAKSSRETSGGSASAASGGGGGD